MTILANPIVFALLEHEYSCLARFSSIHSELRVYDCTCQYRFVQKSEKIKVLYRFDLTSFSRQCQKRLETWNVFGDKIWSAYQRPYLCYRENQNNWKLNCKTKSSNLKTTYIRIFSVL